MRIAFLNRYQNQVNRGVETFISELTARLKLNHQIEVFTDKDADNLSKIINGHFDIVVPTNGRMQSLKVSLGKVVGRYKVLISGHSGIGRDDIWNIAVAKPDVFVALTDFMAEWAKRWAWGTKVVKISNGIDLAKFKANGIKKELNLQPPVILSVGALVWYKHHERTIEALVHLPEASLLIIGEGEEKNKLEELGKSKLGKRFKITSVPYEEMPQIYHSASLFVLPSWDREAFGIVYLEAMASGLAVVAPNDAPRREIIGDAGILVNVNDSWQYAQAIKKALSTNWGEKPRQQACKFSWDKIVLEYERVFKMMIK